MLKQPRLSVVVPVYNGEDLLANCLEALVNQTVFEQIEVIVVDNLCTDRSPEIARSFSVRVVQEEQRGSYAARNRGIREASGDLIAFTDHDAVPEPDWAATILATFAQHPDWSAVQGRSLGINRNCVAEGVQGAYDRILLQDIVRPDGTCIRLDTRNCAIRRSALEEVGLFNEELRFWGDAEMGGRLTEKGHTIGYVADVRIHHINLTRIEKIIDLRVREGWWTAESFRPLGRRFTLRVFPKAALLHLNFADLDERLATRLQDVRELHLNLLELEAREDVVGLVEGIARMNAIGWELGLLQQKAGLQPQYAMEDQENGLLHR